MQPAIERDHTYLATCDDVFFCVSGDAHTKNAIFGMPYYVPTSKLEKILNSPTTGQITVENRRYSKILSNITIDEYPNFIREHFPRYYYSPPGWKTLMRVERTDICKIYDPKELVVKIRQEYAPESGDKNPLLYALYKLEEANPRLIDSAGITGSLLLTQAIHGVIQNDVDIVFYGKEIVGAVKAFSEEVCRTDPRFTGLLSARLDDYVAKKRSLLGGSLSASQLRDTVEGRFDTIFVDGIKLDFTFSKGNTGLSAKPLVLENLETSESVFLTTKVVDDVESFYLPTRLKVEHERFKEIVITARGYICLFRKGDVIRVNGKVYRSSDGNESLVVGGDNDYAVLESR